MEATDHRLPAAHFAGWGWGAGQWAPGGGVGGKTPPLRGRRQELQSRDPRGEEAEATTPHSFFLLAFRDSE